MSRRSARPGTLAVRAANQYRTRDVFAYLALRYYLENAAARSDGWVRRVATEQVLTRGVRPYFPAQHFKDVLQNGRIEHRAMFIPGANEALAEAALLAECSKHAAVFGNPHVVYSYALVESDSRTGLYRHYTTGLRQRHEAIANACVRNPNGIVHYTDIKKFYPSISVEHARAAWGRACNDSRLHSTYRALGERLIDDYRHAGGNNRALLTGPMFSHLLANLVFRDLDQEFCRLPVQYFRYVDDVTLVGDAAGVASARSTVEARVTELGLALHDDHSMKTFSVGCTEWLKGRHDFHERREGPSWAKLIGNLKRYLLLHPADQGALHAALLDEGFRIPVRDFSVAVRESDYAERISLFAPHTWFRRRVRAVSLPSLISQARALRDSLQVQFRELADDILTLSGFARKRRIPKLRYCAGRLVYLASDEFLGSCAQILRNVPELFFHAQVMATVVDGRLDRVMVMGTNAAQAAAQPLKAARRSVTTNYGNARAGVERSFAANAIEQSLAVFLMNGLAVQQKDPGSATDSELVRFATSGADQMLMKSGDPYVREIACLHGISDAPRHAEMFGRAFDQDEAMTMDAIDQLQQSIS